MKKTKFDWLMLGLSAGCSLIGILLCLGVYETMTYEDTVGLIVWSGCVFTIPLLAGLIGVCIAEQIHRRNGIHVVKRGHRFISFLLAIVLGMLLGGGGQALYMLRVDKHTEQVKENSCVSILMDGSTSMADCRDACINAAEQLIDSMDQGNAVQITLFASEVLDYTPLMYMDDAGKDQLKQFVRAMDTVGGTDFDAPLQQALDMLAAFPDLKSRKSVILLTDGKADISDEIQNSYLDEQISLHSICIQNEADGEEPSLKNLKAFVNKSGGKYITLQKSENGTLDMNELLSALQYAYESPEKTVSMNSSLLVYGSEGMNILRFLLRLIVFAIYGLAVTFVYYHRVGVSDLIVSGVIAVLMTIGAIFVERLDILGMIIFVMLSVLFYWCAFTSYYVVDRKQEGELV